MFIFVCILLVLALFAIVGQMWIMHLLVNRIDELVAQAGNDFGLLMSANATIDEKDRQLEKAAFDLNAAYSNIEMLVSPDEAHADAYEALSVAFIRFSLAHNTLLNRVEELEENQTALFNQA